ncbi:uncharacterized protein LOC112090760 [Morus notabilis]|uniref:uncharacterized protein LOC112090760 n=1 Tax=Morus notabilis TaxID=981085 RepID=UPI000CED515D|nr:uncharacterized protein LOC112090760 [Morus notabilis]
MYIRGRGKIDYLTGEKKEPAATDSSYPIWDVENSLDLDLFSDYEWKSTKDCNHYQKTVEDNRIFNFLICLNVEFDEGEISNEDCLVDFELLPSEYILNTENTTTFPSHSNMSYTKGHLNSEGDVGKQKNRELLVYSRRPKSKYQDNLTSEAPRESNPVIDPGMTETITEEGISNTPEILDIDVPIAHRKKSHDHEALAIPEWRNAVMEEMRALKKNETWDIMELPRRKKTQLDIKNAFLNGELEEELYMDMPPGFSKGQEDKRVCKLKRSLYGLKQSLRAWFDRFAKVIKDQEYLQAEMERLKSILATEFEVKDLGQMRYFLGMEVARSNKGISVSQRKYVLDLLTETGILGCKPSDTPIEAGKKIVDDGKLCGQPTHAFAKGTSLGGSIQDTQRSKKQNVVAQSSAEAEFRAVAQGICEVLWLRKLLEELQVTVEFPVKLYCENKSAINISLNPVQHDRTKHVEVDKHFIKENVEKGIICMTYVPTQDQVADIFTKGLARQKFDDFLSKLEMMNIYDPT